MILSEKSIILRWAGPIISFLRHARLATFKRTLSKRHKNEQDQFGFRHTSYIIHNEYAINEYSMYT